MGILDWLRGSGDEWEYSEQGNPMRVIGNQRITAFEQGGGWKFCIARADRDDRDPYFSEVYASQDQAMAAAMAFVEGKESPTQSMTAQWRGERQDRARSYLDESADRLRDLAEQARAATNVTGLRKVERGAASTAKGMINQISRAFHDDLSDADVERAERLRDQAQDLLQKVEGLIADRKAQKG